MLGTDFIEFKTTKWNVNKSSDMLYIFLCIFLFPLYTNSLVYHHQIKELI